MPIASFLPVVNSQQKLVALLPDFPQRDDELSMQLLTALHHINGFERLSNLQLMIPLRNPLSLPSDFENRDYCKNVVLCFLEAECESKEAQQKLKHLNQSGVRLMMDEFSSKSSLIWPDTKSISVNCESGVPAHVLMPGAGMCATPDAAKLAAQAAKLGCGGVYSPPATSLLCLFIRLKISI